MQRFRGTPGGELPDTPLPDAATRTPGSPAFALKAEHVWKRFGTTTALADVSLAVKRAECVALVGESGSGKTTLLRCFNRMVEPEGVIRIEGARADALNAVELRRRVGYVPQEGGLLPHWRVERNVALVPWLREMPAVRDLAARALARVGLEPETFGHRWPHELSGGQRQRVAIARALAAQPSIMLLDEPFGALDAITRAELQQSYAELQRELGVTTLLVTHDLHEAMLLADRIAVMRAGRIEQMADPRMLLESPATEYVHHLLDRAGIRA